MTRFRPVTSVTSIGCAKCHATVVVQVINSLKQFQRRQSREKEVRKLRDKISDLRIEISTITKGIPISKIELQDIGDNKPVPKTDVNVPNPVLAKHSIALEKQPAPKPSKAYLRSQLNTATQILTKS